MSELQPQPILEVVRESDVPGDLDRAIRHLLCGCFPEDAGSFAQARAWHESAPAFSVVARDGHELAGHVGVVVRCIRCGSVPATVAGIQNLCVAVPWRGTGLAQQLMQRAMDHAVQTQVHLGLLFCVPELEPFYEPLGWHKTDVPVFMLDEHGRSGPIPQKNITMVWQRGKLGFPPGAIDLMGRDW